MALSAGLVTGPLCARQQAAGASSPPVAGVGRCSVPATLSGLHSPALPCLIYQEVAQARHFHGLVPYLLIFKIKI